jgi:hypothetical protein
MNSSQQIATSLTNMYALQKCNKKKLRYKLFTKQTNQSVINRPLSLVPFAFIPPEYVDKQLQTIVKGDKQPEQTFKMQPHQVLVVGCVGELYNCTLTKKFTALKTPSNTYIPIDEDRKCIQVDENIYRKFVYRKKIPTPWGTHHYCEIGDYLIVEKNGVYRIQKDVFKKTYKITS